MPSDRPLRIAVAGFQHETNTFSPGTTGLDAFRHGGGWPGLTEGAALPDLFRPLNIPIGGAIAAIEGAGAEPVPLLWASAEPAGPVQDAAFDRIAGRIADGLAAAGPVDGLYLDLHGAMVTEGDPDGEARLVEGLRAGAASGLPVAVSLDLHANLSPRLARAVDIVTIYRSYPHLDMDRTGARAVALLIAAIRQGRRPALAVRQLDRLIPLSAQATDAGPLAALYATLDDTAATADPLASADIALGFPLADIADAGPTVIAQATTPEAAAARAEALLAALAQTAARLENPLLAPEAAVAEAMARTAGGGTVVLADVQDNAGAGALSNAGGLLAALVAGGAERAVIGVLCDPLAASAAHAAGPGATVALPVRDGCGRPVTMLDARVDTLSDGRFTCRGAMQRGVETEIGPTALLRVGATGVGVVVSSERHQAIDA
ncbi:MAG: M81 family metallopeptidase, partial [Pseudomonadota bacterium]